MPARPTTETMPLPAQSWDEVAQLVEGLARLAQSEISSDDFCAALLEHVVRALSASGGVVWSHSTALARQPCAEIDFPAALLATCAARWQDAEPTRTRTSTTEFGHLLSQRIDCEQRPGMLLEVLLPVGRTRADIENRERLLAAFAEIASDFLRRVELRTLRERSATQRGLGQLLLRLHAQLDVRSTAYAIANDGRHWLACGRVSVVELRGAQPQVLAISGIDDVEPRAEAVRCLAELASSVAATREVLAWSAGDESELPPQLQAALHAYLDHGHAARLYALPLKQQVAHEHDSPMAPLAVLVTEWFDQSASQEATRRDSEELASHAALALGNALQHRLPLLPAFEALGKVRRHWQRRSVLVVTLASIAAALLAILAFVPADFTIEATGTLLPQTRVNLFAPHAGVIERVLVDQGAIVARDQALLQLRDRPLEFELVRIRGELQTTDARLATIRAQRSSPASADEPRDDARELAAEEEQLKQQLAAWQKELTILETMQAELKIVSPIAGQLLTWDSRDLLDSRPVKRGQLLLTVADTAGPWVLDLRVEDADMGHLLAAQQQNRALPVSFLLATDPAQTHQGVLAEVAPTSEALDGAAPTTQVKVKLSEPIAGARAGAGVVARIDCGRRPLGYVWLHDLIDAVRSRILF